MIESESVGRFNHNQNRPHRNGSRVYNVSPLLALPRLVDPSLHWAACMDGSIDHPQAHRCGLADSLGESERSWAVRVIRLRPEKQGTAHWFYRNWNRCAHACQSGSVSRMVCAWMGVGIAYVSGYGSIIEVVWLNERRQRLNIHTSRAKHILINRSLKLYTACAQAGRPQQQQQRRG